MVKESRRRREPVVNEFSADCSKIFRCHTQAIFEHNDALHFEVYEFERASVQKSWAVKAET